MKPIKKTTDVDFKEMLKTAPDKIKLEIKKMANVAFVKYTGNGSIQAFSPIFKDITVQAPAGTMGCQRGDIISIKLREDGFNHFELIENLTLKQDIERYDQNAIESLERDAQISYAILKWRESHFKQR